MVQSYLMRPETVKTARSVHDIFRSQGLTLSVAESCTGGLVSHYLTALPGASTFFYGGVIAYSSGIKSRVLDVPRSLICTHGMVSDAAAQEMAENVRLLMGTHYSLSTTGNLGPAVLEGKEVGLVYIAVCRAGSVSVQRLKLSFDREGNKRAATLAALRFLVRFIKGNE